MDDDLGLDTGGGIGALVIRTGPVMDGQEIQLSPVDDDSARCYGMVHPRRTDGGLEHKAVFPTVAAGEYTMWLDENTRHGTVIIRGGEVTEYRWPGEPG